MNTTIFGNTSTKIQLSRKKGIEYTWVNHNIKVNGHKLKIFQKNKLLANIDNMGTTYLDLAQQMFEEDEIT